MSTVWERLGESIGYKLATLVLGPQGALHRRERQVMRAAFRAWCEVHDPITLVAQKGTLRRAVTLMTPTATIPAEAELDPYERTATLVVSTPQRPPNVAVTVCRPWHWGGGRQYPYGQPSLASRLTSQTDYSLGLHAFSETVDKATCEALLNTIAVGSLGKLEMIDIEVHPNRVDVRFVAPTTARAWHVVAAGVIALSEWLVERWPSSYRN